MSLTTAEVHLYIKMMCAYCIGKGNDAIEALNREAVMGFMKKVDDATEFICSFLSAHKYSHGYGVFTLASFKRR